MHDKSFAPRWNVTWKHTNQETKQDLKSKIKKNESCEVWVTRTKDKRLSNIFSSLWDTSYFSSLITNHFFLTNILQIYILQWCQSTIYDYKKTNLLEYICHQEPNHNVFKLCRWQTEWRHVTLLLILSLSGKWYFISCKMVWNLFYGKTCKVNYQALKRL